MKQYRKTKQLKVAIVHDWLTNQGGAERVVLELHKIYPDAPIYTSVFNADKLPEFKNLDVRTSFLQKIPIARTKHQLFPILRTLAFKTFDFSKYDVVISSSSAEAKGINTGPNTLHINYCHTPTRYYWSHYESYRKNPGMGALSPLVSALLPLLIKGQRKRDLEASKQPDFYIANSSEVQQRIKKYYNRDATVIYPPVDTERFKPDNQKAVRHGYVIAGRQVPYKRVDLAVRACTELKLPLTVIGSGPEHHKLQAMAGLTVRFLSNVSDKEIAGFFQKASAFIFPSFEDFGIVPVEAMAAGTPVIAFSDGGAQDYVIPGKTGVFFEQQTVKSLKNALLEFEGMNFKPLYIQHHAEQFSEAAFAQKIEAFVLEKLGKK